MGNYGHIMQQHVERAAARGRMAGNRGRDALSVPAAQEEPGGYGEGETGRSVR